MYHLNRAVRTWAIAIGIRKQQIECPYRCSHAGNKFFNWIHSWITENTSTKNATQLDLKQVIVPLKRCPNTRSVKTAFSHINARSIYHKKPDFQDYITTNKISVCAITKTWLKNDPDDLRHKEIAPIGYNIISHSRSSGRQGGGTALVYKNGFNIVDKTDTHKFETMEFAEYNIMLKTETINMYVIYRPPSTSVLKFCEDLFDLLSDNIVQDRSKLLLVGDFNIHVDDHNNPDTITFNDFMESIGIRNHINFTMHTSHHTLDLVLTDGNDRLVLRVDWHHYLSDHCFVDMIIKAGIDPPPAKQITYRKLKNINLSNFNIDVLHEINKFRTMPLDQ